MLPLMEILDLLPMQPSTSKSLREPIRGLPSLLDRLRVAPERFQFYLRMVSLPSTSHVLEVLKSLFPRFPLESLVADYALGTT